MSEYPYMNEAEREWTQKYEGTYTPEEIELNKKLRDACDKDIVDFGVVEDLLSKELILLGEQNCLAGICWNIFTEILWSLNLRTMMA